MIRLLRSPTQIAHCEVKSNRVGLAYVVKVWAELQELVLDASDREENVVNTTEDHISDGISNITINDGVSPVVDC
jgi:hypothetical protein